MSAIIHIEITESAEFVYKKPIIAWAKKEFKEITTFDIDNHSDAQLFQFAASLIEKEERVVIYIDVKNEAGSGKLLSLAETIIKNKEKCLVFMKGESKILQKMFSLLKESFIFNQNELEIRKLMTNIFQ